MSQDTYRNFLLDLGTLLRERAGRASGEARAEASPFARGQAIAYAEVLSLMQQQAAAFGIPLRDVGLDGFDAERDLLG
jgi:hypothetical protein